MGNKNECNVAIHHKHKMNRRMKWGSPENQLFCKDVGLLPQGKEYQMRAFSWLQNKYATLQKSEVSPWHTQGRYLPVLEQRRLFYCREWENGRTGRLEALERMINGRSGDVRK